MTSHYSIRKAIADAVKADSTLEDFCIDNFGRGALAIVDWYGANGEPGENDAPFVFVYPDDGQNEAGFVDEETFSVRIVVAGMDRADAPSTTVIAERSATANGEVVNGIAEIIEQFRSHVERIIQAANLGAVPRTYTREEVSVADYPLEWATVTVEFYEPQTIGGNS